ncbi:hypothetical protein MNBD_GAMMA09-810 [hydrothermal vent metagenome]|uniref:Rho-specific inhibitor of transcription termination (YaeO) n=1 Tax=hydrothermal vent metagenome TaxID=652676 RepID=A0A3B0XJW7_9ZZZZ
MPDKPYQPIACADYDIFEIAIMRGHLLILQWRSDAGETLKKTVKPVSLDIYQGAEYLCFELLNMDILKLRLDKIISAEMMSAIHDV